MRRIELVGLFEMAFGLFSIAFIECVLAKESLGIGVVFNTKLSFDDFDELIGFGWMFHRVEERASAKNSTVELTVVRWDNLKSIEWFALSDELSRVGDEPSFWIFCVSGL